MQKFGDIYKYFVHTVSKKLVYMYFVQFLFSKSLKNISVQNVVCGPVRYCTVYTVQCTAGLIEIITSEIIYNLTLSSHQWILYIFCCFLYKTNQKKLISGSCLSRGIAIGAGPCKINVSLQRKSGKLLDQIESKASPPPPLRL